MNMPQNTSAAIRFARMRAPVYENLLEQETGSVPVLAVGATACYCHLTGHAAIITCTSRGLLHRKHRPVLKCQGSSSPSDAHTSTVCRLVILAYLDVPLGSAGSIRSKVALLRLPESVNKQTNKQAKPQFMCAQWGEGGGGEMPAKNSVRTDHPHRTPRGPQQLVPASAGRNPTGQNRHHYDRPSPVWACDWTCWAGLHGAAIVCLSPACGGGNFCFRRRGRVLYPGAL